MREPLPENARCRIHGGAGGRPRGKPDHRNSRLSRVEGRRRWIARMREAKAAGLIEKIPGGRRARDLPKLPTDRRLKRAVRVIEAAMAKRKKEKAAVPAVVERPWQQLDKAQKLGEATDRGLDEIYAFLMKPVDPEKNEKLYLAKISTALSVVSAQIRLDSAALMAQTSLNTLPDTTVKLRLEEAFALLDAVPLSDDDGEGDEAGAEAGVVGDDSAIS
jgi:hypothetical protein